MVSNVENVKVDSFANRIIGRTIQFTYKGEFHTVKVERADMNRFDKPYITGYSEAHQHVRSFKFAHMVNMEVVS